MLVSEQIINGLASWQENKFDVRFADTWLWITWKTTGKCMQITPKKLVVYLPLWKMMEFVNWEDDIPNWMEKTIQMFQTTNQNRWVNTVSSRFEPSNTIPKKGKVPPQWLQVALTNRQEAPQSLMAGTTVRLYVVMAIRLIINPGWSTLWWTYKKLLKMAIYSGFSH